MDPRLAGLELKTSLLSIADLVFPRVCVVCGTPLMPEERHLCMECACDIPYTRFENMSRNPMADSFNGNLARRDYRGEYVSASALFYYSGGFRNITRELKYRRNFGVGKFFAGEFGRRLSESPLYADADCVVPVPLHWMRKWSRGYNQAEVIATGIAKSLNVPCCPGALRRRHRTHTQVSLSGEERSHNVEGAFECTGRLPSDVSHILLVDDVYTTGATLCACFDALKNSARISVLTLAYVG